MLLKYTKQQYAQSSISHNKKRCFPYGMVVDKEITAKICSLIWGIERDGYLPSWLVPVEQHREQ